MMKAFEHTSPRLYYACWFSLDNVNRYLIWYHEGSPSFNDGVLADEARRVPTFHSVDELRAFAATIQVKLEDEEPLLNDLDPVAEWLREPAAFSIDCPNFLGALNLFGDVARSVDLTFDPQSTELLDIYNKLFWGSNLPAMTPEGEHYVPSWDEDEVQRLADALATGLAIFRAHVTLIT